MNLVKKALHKFNGLHYRQEYLCLARESFNQPLYVYLVNDKRIIADVTSLHLFVGYCPLVFAFTNMDLPENIQLIFTNRQLQPNDIFLKKDAIALLKLRRIKQQVADSTAILYYEGTYGKHYFQSAFHQLIGSLINRLYNKKPGNVFLHTNLYRQVQVAYSVPRTISLITVSDGNGYNLFPTDLHGPSGDQLYIISLRTGGKACQQVATAGKILIAEVDSNMYKTVYALGKNHMQPLKPVADFPFSGQVSTTFGLAVPQNAFLYRELNLIDTFTRGIHKIMLFKIVHSQQIMPSNDTLAHIHNSYATWRYKKGLQGNYLLR